jgi:glycosyltransferase A (GT-A) superfamily protein (DUF2064 family)
VFIPSCDGGYVLIGLRRVAPEVFGEVPWRTPVVMAQPRERLRGLGWHWWKGEPLADVDEGSDLVHVPAGWDMSIR